MNEQRTPSDPTKGAPVSDPPQPKPPQSEQEARPSRNSRRSTFRVFTCGVSTLLASLLILIFVLFHQKPHYYENPDSDVTGLKSVYDAKLGWRNIPSSTGSTYGHAVTINSHGLRDREYKRNKPGGGKRILVLGDSYVWGYGVGQQEIFTEVLEDNLKRENQHWEVINTGVSGWGTDQQYLYLVDEGLHYSPDVVVVAYFIGNDTHNCLSSKQYGISKPVFFNASLELMNVPVPHPREKSQPWNLDISTTADPIDLTLAILEAMGKKCSERDCEFIFMKFGMFHQAFHTPDFLAWNDRLVAESPKLQHVRFLDLDEAFATEQVSQDELLRGNHDGHWNAFGHGVVATCLQSYLSEEGLLE